MNPAQPPPGTPLCHLDEIADPGAKGFLFREGDMLFLGFVARAGGLVRGYVDRCPHAGMPLAAMPDRYFTRERDLILCSVHGALFRAHDGVCVAGPCAGKALTAWPIAVEGGMILAA